MVKTTKKQRRLKRKNKKRQYKKRRTKKKNKHEKGLEPWQAPKMKMYQGPSIFPEDMPKEKRLDIIKEVGAKAQKNFDKKYPKIKKWFEEYDAPYFLSFSSLYFMSTPEGTDPEMSGRLDFYHHYLEIMQAFSLMQKRSYNTKILDYDEIERFKQEIKEIGELMDFRSLNIPDKLKNDEERNAYILRREIMANTTGVRNWAYHHQMKKVVETIAKLVKDDFEKIYNINPEKLFKALIKMAESRNDTLNEHIDNVRSFIKKQNYKEMIKSYNDGFPHTKKIEGDEIEEVWTTVGKNLKNLKSMLIYHSDLQLYRAYSFNLDEFVKIYGDKTKIKELKKILDSLSYEFGDLEKNNAEYFILDNPTHKKPFIKLEENKYYSSIFGIFNHLSLGLLEDLLSKDKKLQQKYEDIIKPKYLEESVKNIFKMGFPNAKIYTSVKWNDPGSGKEYETDLVLILDTFMLVVEEKSGKLSPMAKRGDPESLSKTLERLIDDPSKQAYNFISFLKKESKKYNFSCKEGLCEIDTSDINYYVPLGVTFSNIGSIGSNLKKLIEAKITSKNINELAISINFTDLESIFELLPLESQKIHYFARRKEWEKNMNYDGDELDLLAFYLDNGFNIGEDEFKGDLSISMLLKSKELDHYFVGTNDGFKVEKPRQQMSQWWSDILDRLSIVKPKNWLETSFILLNSTKEDQEKFEKNFDKLIGRIKNGRTELKHNWIALLSGPEERRYLIAGYPYTTEDKEERNSVVMEIINSEDAKKVRGVVVIAVNINKREYPYNLLAGDTRTNLFDI